MWNGRGAVPSRRLLKRSSRDSLQRQFWHIQSTVSHFASALTQVDYAIGAVLEQEGEDGQWHIVAYGSHSLTDAERKWSSTEKECFAVVHFMNHWWHLLLGAQFEVLTGHQALSKIFGQAEPPTGKLARWILKTQSFQPFNLKYQPGWVNNNSDTMSRQPIARLVASIEPVKKTGKVEELREDPAFEWILKALNRDESGCQGKTTRQLALLDHMVINENGELYHTHWRQGKTATKGILLQWVVPKSRREQLLELHHDTPVGGTWAVTSSLADCAGLLVADPLQGC